MVMVALVLDDGESLRLDLIGHAVSCVIVGVRGRGGVDEVEAVSSGIVSAISPGSHRGR